MCIYIYIYMYIHICVYRYRYIYIYILFTPYGEIRIIIIKQNSLIVRFIISGGIACLTPLVCHMCSSKVMNNATNKISRLRQVMP